MPGGLLAYRPANTVPGGRAGSRRALRAVGHGRRRGNAGALRQHRPAASGPGAMTLGRLAGPDAAQPSFGVRSMFEPLRRVLLRRPVIAGEFSAAGWRAPDAGLLARQHEAFGQLLTDLGCMVEVAPAIDGMVDATYVRDPGLVTGTGAVLFQMAKPARTAEPAHLGAALQAAGVPVTARLSGAARADGGDFIWLDERTVLAGRSYRTNAEGLRQMAAILAVEGAGLEPVDLPHDHGPGHVLHLMSLISPAAGDLAVVYPPLAPVALMQTLAALEAAGCEVHGYDGSEISIKGDGGPTCLTAPIWRNAGTQ